MYDSITVANHILERAKSKDDTLTPMQVLKLVYIAHGWALGLLGRPLISDEVQAWEYGPVIPRLYNAMRHFKGDAVKGPLPGAPERMSPTDVAIVDQVYDKYGRLSGPALSRLTHEPGSPWDLTYRPGAFGIVIAPDLIEDHYARKAKTPRKAAS